MEKFITNAIKFLSLLMFAGGIILFFVCKNQAWEASLGYFKDKEAVAMWNFLSVQCIITAISSVFFYGFGFVVEAACLYIEKRKQDIYNEEMGITESTEE